MVNQLGFVADDQLDQHQIKINLFLSVPHTRVNSTELSFLVWCIFVSVSDSLLGHYFLSFMLSHNVLGFLALVFHSLSPSLKSLAPHSYFCSFWLYERGSRVSGWPCIIRPLITTTVLQLNIEIPLATRKPLWGDETFTLMARWGRCGSALILQTAGLSFMSFQVFSAVIS